MKNYNKMVAIIFIVIVFTIVLNILIYIFLLNDIKNKNLNMTQIKENVIESIITNEIDENIQVFQNLDKEETINNFEAIGKNDKEITGSREIVNDVETIGTIKIPQIDFQGTIYKGTSLDVLAKGVGHFDNTPYLNGNVCLAAHNTSKFWARLNQLKEGDLIIYDSFLGEKNYSVSSLLQIDETDWSNLKNTEENTLTLITCIKGNKPKRLCVKAVEI